MENTVKIHIMGSAAVVVSAVSLEDWKLVEKYMPKALTVTDENGGTVFTASTGEGTGSFTEDRVVWGETVTEDGRATVTVLFGTDVKDRLGAVLDATGNGIPEIIGIEEKIPDLVKEIRESRERIAAYVTVL